MKDKFRLGKHCIGSERSSQLLAAVGAVIGYITGIVVSTGPINPPFFLAYGLVKGAYLGTEALGSLAVYVAKAITFRSLNALPLEIVTKGLTIGSSLLAGLTMVWAGLGCAEQGNMAPTGA